MKHLESARDRLLSRMEGLIPKVRNRAYQLLAVAADQGVPLRVTFAARTFKVQGALYVQGREPLDTVNSARVSAGLPMISLQENAHTVTDARPGKSWHNWGRAIDVVPIEFAESPDLSDPDAALWKSNLWPGIGTIGKLLGFEWGGDWTGRKDRPHFQFTEGATLGELMKNRNRSAGK